MEVKKIETQNLITTLHDLIEKEFIHRNPDYHKPKQALVIYQVNPLAVIFNFSNSIKKELKPKTYQFEIDKYDDIEHIKTFLSHRAKLNYDDSVQNKNERIYFTMELF